MDEQRESIIREVELDAIKVDLFFYLDLISKLVSDTASNILIFGLLPYESLFTVEAFKYIKSYDPDYARSLLNKHDRVITSSRTRIKFFDDTKKGVDGLEDLIAWIFEVFRELLINKHKGFLAPLKKALQPDLGIFGYKGHIIGTTHAGLLNTGFEKGDLSSTSEEMETTLGTSSFSVAQELGKFLGQLSMWSELPQENEREKYVIYKVENEKLGYIDRKSSNFFLNIFNGPSTVELNFGLLYFLTTVNYLRFILNDLIEGTQPTYFKVKFICLYHLISSLRKLQRYYYPRNILTGISKNYFKLLLDDKDLEQIGRQSKFRNLLVHYRIQNVPTKYINSSVSLYGLVEFFFKGQSLGEINEKLDEQIESISTLLEEWSNWPTDASLYSIW